MNKAQRRDLQLRTAVKLRAAGRNQREIADDLGVSRWTVNKMLKEADGRGIGQEEAEAAKKASIGEGGEVASPEEIQADAELDVLRMKARRGLDVGPQITVVLSRKIQSKLVNELAAGTLKSKDAAGALSQVEQCRKSAELAINLREQIQADLAKELLEAADRVLDGPAYDSLVKELERLERVGI